MRDVAFCDVAIITDHPGRGEAGEIMAQIKSVTRRENKKIYDGHSLRCHVTRQIISLNGLQFCFISFFRCTVKT